MSGNDRDKESSGENAAKPRRLQEEIKIDFLKGAKVIEMPEITEEMSIEQRRSIADLKRSLWNQIFEPEWILERQRVRECVDKAKKLGLIGPPDSVECPFCFDDIQNLKETRIFSCCGKVCCDRCGEKVLDMHPNGCPFCRSKIGISDKENTAKLIKRANSGDAMSQFKVGENYSSGCGVAEDMHKARYWFECAALQGSAEAQGNVGMAYMEGLGGEQSYSDAERYMKMAAKKSCPNAQLGLGMLMRRQERNEEALQWFTLSASQGFIKAYKALATMYDGKGAGRRMPLSFYWCKKAALAGDEESVICTTLQLPIFSSFCIGRDGYDFPTMVKEVGQNPIPELLFWLRKVASAKESKYKEKATAERSKYESMVRERCSGCWKLATSFDDRLKACRCHAAFYCSKKCQISHWKGGHVLDCWNKDGKFLPCPNDEKWN